LKIPPTSSYYKITMQSHISNLKVGSCIPYLITLSEDDLSMLPFHMEEKDSKPTKRKNLKKIIFKGKLGAAIAGESSSYDIHGMEMMGSSDSTYGAKFVPITPVDGYEAEDDSN